MANPKSINENLTQITEQINATMAALIQELKRQLLPLPSERTDNQLKNDANPKSDRKVFICGYNQDEDCLCVATDDICSEYYDNSVCNDIVFANNDEGNSTVDMQGVQSFNDLSQSSVTKDEQQVFDKSPELDADREVEDHENLLAKIEDPSSTVTQVCAESIHDKVISVSHSDFSSPSLSTNTAVETIYANKNGFLVADNIFDKSSERNGDSVELKPKPPDAYNSLDNLIMYGFNTTIEPKTKESTYQYLTSGAANNQQPSQVVYKDDANWFSSYTVHRLERQVVPHYFSGKLMNHTHMECWNHIAAKYVENPETRLAVYDFDGLAVGINIDDMTRILHFLDYWGIINSCVANVYPGLGCRGHEDFNLDTRAKDQLSENPCDYCSRPFLIVYYQSHKKVNVLLSLDCNIQLVGVRSSDFLVANCSVLLMKDCSFPQESFFIGFDISTQSLKTTVLNSNLNIVTSEIVNSDSELPHYKTKEGVYRDPSVDGQIVSPTLIWVEAFDLILQRLEKYKLDFGKIVVVSGNGQQHGSVYWKMGSSAILSSLDLKKPLVDQLRDAFSINELPIWMNSSTTEQCIAIEKTIEGAMELSKFTGSRAHERYTGPQIRRIFETQPKIYQNTKRISLVSSFMASILIGEYACIDQTDGAGMNLMDTKQRNWSKIALGATTPGLEKKFGKLAPAHAVAGFIDPYFVERFNFNKSYLVVQWSGDKPNTLAGLTLNTLGDLAISLGTNDTVFGITTEHKLSLEGHVFLNPVDTKVYMVMLCYKNGSLAREEGRNRCANKSWETFNIFLEQIPPLNGGKLDFYYRDHEILPPLPVGFHHYILSNFDGDTLSGLIGQEVKDFNPPSEVRAGQFLSMQAHAESFGMPSPPNRILTTGGASANDTILNSIASIFGLHAITSELHHKHYKDATYGMFLHEYGKETTDAYEVVTFNKVIHVRFPSCQQLLNFLKIAKSDRGAKSPADISLNINYFQALLIEIARQTSWQHLIGFNGAPSIVKNDAYIQLVFTVNINSFCKKVQVIEQEIFEEIRRHGLKVAVPGIPKTINNDIPIIDKSFGFDTAIKEAQRSIIAAHVKVESVDNGIGLVKFRGHYSGFIAMYAITASRDADRSCYFAYLPP